MVYYRSHKPSNDSADLDVQGMDHHQGQLQQLPRKHARQILKLPRRRQLDLANTRCSLGGLVARDGCNMLLS